MDFAHAGSMVLKVTFYKFRSKFLKMNRIDTVEIIYSLLNYLPSIVPLFRYYFKAIGRMIFEKQFTLHD